ncbi:MAG: hypothetical protein QXQ77_02780 [Candidatus Aenigmatarchaeota archaeon]
MKAQLSFLMKGIYLILVIILIFIVSYLTTNHTYLLYSQSRQFELKESALNTLDKLVSSNCLGFETGNTTHKIIDLGKLLEFVRKYPDFEPDCARDMLFDYRIEVEKFESNISFLGEEEGYLVCFTQAPCVTANTYLSAKKYQKRHISVRDIVENKIKDCDAILLESSFPLSNNARQNLLTFVENGKLLVTTSFALDVLASLFPNYIASCNKDVCPGAVHTCKKCIQLTEEGKKELGLETLDYPFWANFYEGDFLFKVLSDEVKILANFSSLSCTGGDVFSPPADCSNAVLIMFNYGKGTVVHQVMILGGLTGSQEYNKVNIFTKILEKYGGLGKGIASNFKDRQEKWEFGVKNFSKKSALRNEITFSLPVLIRIKDNQIQPGKITIRMVDGELEELAGIFDSVCIFNTSKKLKISLSQALKGDKNDICIVVEGEKICKKLLCEMNEFSIAPGNYLLSVEKFGDKINVKY